RPLPQVHRPLGAASGEQPCEQEQHEPPEECHSADATRFRRARAPPPCCSSGVTRLRARSALALLLASACTHHHESPHESLPGPDPAKSPRYDRVWALATHNSYWIDRRA